jgi:apolipoprotein D and lipocalin family protein
LDEDDMTQNKTVLTSRWLATLAASLLLGACGFAGNEKPPLPHVAYVDLERFQGDWYVLDFIPLFPERDAHNGIESYRLRPDGKIATTYQFRKGAVDGPLKTYHPVATVVPGTGNAHWKMQFIWPFKADYHISYLSEDYSEVIIAREKRDYVWLMARQPEISPERRDALRKRIGAMGYDLEKLKAHPQQWGEQE